MNTEQTPTPGSWISVMRGNQLEVRGPVLDSAPNGCAPIVSIKQRRTAPRKGQEQGYHDFDARTLANARLIAAAPDLLEACINAHKRLSDQYAADCQQADWHNNNTPGVGQTVDYMNYPPRPAELDQLAAAIAKATQP